MSSRESTPGGGSRLPETAWALRASRKKVRLLAVAVALFVFFTSLSIDYGLYRLGATPVEYFSASDGIAALISFLFVTRLVSSAAERRQAVIERLVMIGEVNHHIRNALEVIQMSAHTTQDQEAIRAINAGVNRIEWVLKEILASRPEPGGPPS